MSTQPPPLKPVPDRRQAPTARRRSERAECEVAVVVKWAAKDGSQKDEVTKTKVVNAHGCLLTLKVSLLEGTPVELVNQQSREARTGHVAWCGSVGPDGRTQVAIELADSDPKFWGQKYTDFMVWVAGQSAGRAV